MHEVSVLNNILEIVENSIKDKKVVNVDKIYLSVGILSGVSKLALIHAFSLIEKTDVFSNTQLEIHDCPLVVWCQDCQLATTLHEDISLLCSNCKKPLSTIISGKELNIDKLEVIYET